MLKMAASSIETTKNTWKLRSLTDVHHISKIEWCGRRKHFKNLAVTHTHTHKPHILFGRSVWFSAFFVYLLTLIFDVNDFNADVFHDTATILIMSVYVVLSFCNHFSNWIPFWSELCMIFGSIRSFCQINEWEWWTMKCFIVRIRHTSRVWSDRILIEKKLIILFVPFFFSFDCCVAFELNKTKWIMCSASKK